MGAPAAAYMVASYAISYMGARAQARAAQRAAAYGAVGAHMAADASVQAGVNAMYTAYKKASLTELEGEEVQRRAKREAELIKSAAVKMRATQTAAMSKSGIVTNLGSSAMVLSQTSALAEQDMLIAIQSGNDALIVKEYEAEQLRKAGDEAFTQGFYDGINHSVNAAGIIQAGRDNARASILSGFSNVAQSGFQAYQIRTA